MDKRQAGKDTSEPSATQWVTKAINRKDSTDDVVMETEEIVSRAKITRQQAEEAREKISAEIMEATKRLYQTLIEEGEQTVERAKQLESVSELKLLESQRELKHAQDLKAEADSYRVKVIAQTRQQSQDMLQEAQTVKADAVAFRETVLSEVKRQSDMELAQAQATRVEAENYREQVISETQKQAEEILNQARQNAHQEGAEIRQKYSIEADKLLAQAEIIKEAAHEELEAQRLYSQAANLQSESQDVLDQARAKIANASSVFEEPSPSSESTAEEVTRLKNLWASIDSAASSQADLADQLSRLESEASVTDRHLEEAPVEPAPQSQQEPKSRQPSPPKSPGPKPKSSAKSAVASLLPSNELVLGLELNNQSKAYPMKTLSQCRVINDSLAGMDLLMTVAPPSELGMMFNRNLDGQTLTFQPLPDLDGGVAMMKDLDTETTWEALTGRAVEGPLAGSELERMNPEYSFWFAWCQLHPNTKVYQQD